MALGNVSGIVLKHSLLLNDEPDPAELTPGEIALNANSKSMALFALDEAGLVKKIGGGDSTLVTGAVAPITPTRGQMWIDTSPTPPAQPELKIYDGSAWITLAKPDGVSVVANAASGVLGVGAVDEGTF